MLLAVCVCCRSSRIRRSFKSSLFLSLSDLKMLNMKEGANLGQKPWQFGENNIICPSIYCCSSSSSQKCVFSLPPSVRRAVKRSFELCCCDIFSDILIFEQIYQLNMYVCMYGGCPSRRCPLLRAFQLDQGEGPIGIVSPMSQPHSTIDTVSRTLSCTHAQQRFPNQL